MNDLWKRTWNELRNPRKGGVVAVLLVVALVMWGRLLWQQTPSSASAEVTAPAASVDGVEAMLDGPVLPGEPARRRVELTLRDKLGRDLFALPRGAYAPVQVEDESSGQTEEKSSPEPADENGQLASVRRAASELSLQSVATGEHPYAVINGRVLGPGQRINGLTVVRIGKRHVVLGWQDVTVRLDMEM